MKRRGGLHTLKAIFTVYSINRDIIISFGCAMGRGGEWEGGASKHDLAFDFNVAPNCLPCSKRNPHIRPRRFRLRSRILAVCGSPPTCFSTQGVKRPTGSSWPRSGRIEGFCVAFPWYFRIAHATRNSLLLRRCTRRALLRRRIFFDQIPGRIDGKNRLHRFCAHIPHTDRRTPSPSRPKSVRGHRFSVRPALANRRSGPESCDEDQEVTCSPT